MKLWLKGISGSWWETVTQGSLWLLRGPQGSAEPRLEVRAPQTRSFILDMAVPSLTGLSLGSSRAAQQQHAQQAMARSSSSRGTRMPAMRAAS